MGRPFMGTTRLDGKALQGIAGEFTGSPMIVIAGGGRDFGFPQRAGGKPGMAMNGQSNEPTF